MHQRNSTCRDGTSKWCSRTDVSTNILSHEQLAFPRRGPYQPHSLTTQLRLLPAAVLLEGLTTHAMYSPGMLVSWPGSSPCLRSPCSLHGVPVIWSRWCHRWPAACFPQLPGLEFRGQRSTPVAPLWTCYAAAFARSAQLKFSTREENTKGGCQAVGIIHCGQQNIVLHVYAWYGVSASPCYIQIYY